MDRRDFFKTALAGSTATVCGTGPSQARPNLEPAEEAVGMLYDSTLCVGCKACVASCKEINSRPPSHADLDNPWDNSLDLSSETFNVIKVYREGTAETKDSVKDGFAFEKRSCMHCVDPGCVTACPTTSMRRDPKTGIVSHHPESCIGCRNCMVACPYNVPQFDYDNLFGSINKCQMCNQPGVERINKGQMTGCAEACPTGATLFGTRKELLAEAKRRMALNPGDSYNYPVGDVGKPDTSHEKEVPKYRKHIWGEKEAGGTNVMHIASVPFDKLGMPPLVERSPASISDTVQHTLYSYLALPAVVLAGLAFIAKRNVTADEGDKS